ncbi:MAG: tetratricopeptide repeat protein [Clostridia bacterium]
MGDIIDFNKGKELYFTMATTAEENGNYDKALNYYKCAIEENAESEVYLQYSNLLYDLGYNDAAINIILMGIIKYPDDGELYSNLLVIIIENMESMETKNNDLQFYTNKLTLTPKLFAKFNDFCQVSDYSPFVNKSEVNYAILDEDYKQLDDDSSNEGASENIKICYDERKDKDFEQTELYEKAMQMLFDIIAEVDSNIESKKWKILFGKFKKLWNSNNFTIEKEQIIYFEGLIEELMIFNKKQANDLADIMLSTNDKWIEALTVKAVVTSKSKGGEQYINRLFELSDVMIKPEFVAMLAYQLEYYQAVIDKFETQNDKEEKCSEEFDNYYALSLAKLGRYEKAHNEFMRLLTICPLALSYKYNILCTDFSKNGKGKNKKKVELLNKFAEEFITDDWICKVVDNLLISPNVFENFEEKLRFIFFICCVDESKDIKLKKIDELKIMDSVKTFELLKEMLMYTDRWCDKEVVIAAILRFYPNSKVNILNRNHLFTFNTPKTPFLIDFYENIMMDIIFEFEVCDSNIAYALYDELEDLNKRFQSVGVDEKKLKLSEKRTIAAIIIQRLNIEWIDKTDILNWYKTSNKNITRFLELLY